MGRSGAHCDTFSHTYANNFKLYQSVCTTIMNVHEYTSWRITAQLSVIKEKFIEYLM